MTHLHQPRLTPGPLKGETMTVTIEEMEQRIRITEKVQDEMNGDRQNGLQVTQVGEYTVIDDGQDRWLCETYDWDLGCESVISDILTGDLRYDEDDPAEWGPEWYTALCNAIDAIYTRVGSQNDLAEVAELDDAPALFEALGEDYDEWMAEQLEEAKR